MDGELTEVAKKDEVKRDSKIQKFLTKQLAKGIKLESIALSLGSSYTTLLSWKYGAGYPRDSTRKLIKNIYGVNV